MSGIEKVPYTPSTTRRFEVSHDHFSRSRLRSLLAARRVLHYEVPFFAGMSLFGSLSKGKMLDDESARTTDIDLIAYIDERRFQKTAEEFFTHTPYTYELHDRDGTGSMAATGDRIVLVEDYVRRRTVEAVDTQLRALGSADCSTSVSVEFVGTEDSRFSLFNYVSSETWTIEQYRRNNGFSYTQAHAMASRPIAGLFFFDIGGDLRKYRMAFMRELQSLPPEQRDRHWSTVWRSMRLWERSNQVPPDIRHEYPETFDQAIEYYGVDDTGHHLEEAA